MAAHTLPFIPCARHQSDPTAVTLTATNAVRESIFRLARLAQLGRQNTHQTCRVCDLEANVVSGVAALRRPSARTHQAGVRGPTLTPRLGALLALAAAASMLAACGGSDPTLTSEESAKVADYRASIGQVVLDGREPERAQEGVAYMVKLCKAKPDATYDAGHEGEMTVRDVAADEAETLKGYRDAWAQRLRGCG